MPTSRGSRQPKGGERLFLAYVVLLIWLPLPLGSNHAWAWSIMEVWVFLIAIIWLVQYLRGEVSLSRPFLRAWPATACLAVVVLWVPLQGLALPEPLLAGLSPAAAQVHEATGTEATITLDRYATHESGLKTLTFFLLFCLTLLLVNRRSRVRTLLQAIVFAGVFQAAYGALMTLSGMEYGFFVKKEFYQGVATGTFVNRNHLAGYLEMCLALGIGLMLADLSSRPAVDWRDSARRLLRTLLGAKARVRVSLVIMVIGLVLTHSRMGNSAFFVSLIVVGAAYILVVRRLSRATLVFFASLLIVDLLVVSNYFGIEEVAARMQKTTADMEYRNEVSRDTLEIVKDFPLTGTGAGSFASVYPGYDTGDVGFVLFRHAHNDYLQFAAEFGSVVFLVLAAFVLMSFYNSIWALFSGRDRLAQGVGFGVTMAVLSLLIHSAVDFNLQIPANAALFVVILALGWIAACWDFRRIEARPREWAALKGFSERAEARD